MKEHLDLLARLPLADAVLGLWRLALPDSRLEQLYQSHRQRCYHKIISFPLMVHLIADALTQRDGSGRAVLEQSRERGALNASLVAAYGKLRRMPIAVSEALVEQASAPWMQVYPEVAHGPWHRCLDEFELVVLDGKAIKRVSKRLKALRGIKGGVLGGRALVALRLRSGMIAAMAAHEDGEVNDVKLLPQLLPRVRRCVVGKRLYVMDRQFCDLTQPAWLCQEGDEWLVRHHRKLHFCKDATRPSQRGIDAEGRVWEQDWGWIGKPRDKRRRYVRRLRLALGKETLVLLTSLLDATAYPAKALLELYRGRWGIERVFQQVTEVFGLQGLIGSSARASVFQFAFCLLLYNMTQVLRAHVAAGQRKALEEVSTEKLFRDVEKQLVAWNELADVEETVVLKQPRVSVEAMRAQLTQRVGVLWRGWWRKAPAQKRRCVRPHGGSAAEHFSVYRLMKQHKKSK